MPGAGVSPLASSSPSRRRQGVSSASARQPWRCRGRCSDGTSAATLYEKRFGSPLHPVTANAIQYATGLVTTLPLVLLFGQYQLVWSVEMVASLGYLVVGNSLIALTLLLAMIRRGAATQVSALFYLIPPTAALLAWLLIDEPMPMLGWVGMAVAALGVILAGRGQTNR
ncbi:DMT family transporter [Salinicola endophyticus]|uniref:DMT family transporter n=1 Tax=Salinicola endophyticus TaxID=1949083 RepID=A0AB74UCP1_9GAMM